LIAQAWLPPALIAETPLSPGTSVVQQRTSLLVVMMQVPPLMADTLLASTQFEPALR
jgi:hypothetical protein